MDTSKLSLCPQCSTILFLIECVSAASGRHLRPEGSAFKLSDCQVPITVFNRASPLAPPNYRLMNDEYFVGMIRLKQYTEN